MVLERAAAADRVDDPLLEPTYIGAADRPWFAWLHRAAQPTGVGLVIVPPFGHEAVSSHASLRRLAEHARGTGVTAARIDLDGTGDSAGDDLDAARVDAWCASIAAAIDLVRGTGATRIVLAGVRLGATLAALVAERRSDVAALVAIFPVISGKRWLREMRALQAALDLATPPPNRTTDETIQEVVGFAITAATRDTLTAIDLEHRSVRTAPSVLVIDRDDLPTSDRWIAHLRELGANVTSCRLPGYVEMMLDAHLAQIPTQMIDAAVAFAAAVESQSSAISPAPSRSNVASLGDLVEYPVAIPAGAATLHAIACRPTGAARPTRALVLLNAGCVHRIGPNRLYVAAARRVATEGTLVLRVDLSGIGDTPSRPGEPPRIVFPAAALAEVAAILAWCRGAGVERVLLGGLCSGGHHAMHAAFDGDNLAGIIVVNPGGPASEDHVKPYEAISAASRYMHSVRSLVSWKKLFTGRVDTVRIARMLTIRARAVVQSRLVEVARRLHIPVANDFGQELASVARRGVATTFLFGADEPSLVHFRERAGGVLRRLEASGKVVVRVIEGSDHTFTQRWSHDVFVDELAAAVRRIG